MDPKEIDAAVAITQFIISYLKNRGLSEEEIDAVFEKSRQAKEARPSEDLPDA
jgi:hypothetical protein